MEYYIYDIDSKYAKYYDYKDYRFDYIPVEYIKKIDTTEWNIIGFIKLKEIKKEDADNRIIAPQNIQKHYFKLNLFDEKHKLKENKVIGYLLVDKDKYVAIYKGLF